MRGTNRGCRLAACAALVSCLAGTAAGQTVFSNNSGISIPMLGGASTPYPSEITVSGLTDIVGLVRVRINGLSHEEVNDLDILLVAPDGTKVLLMSDVGGLNAVMNIDLVFDDAYPPLTHDPLVSGTYSPTNLNDGFGTDDFDPPAPPPPYESVLSALTGKAGNGTWQLYVMDDFGGEGGSIDGWELEIFEGIYVTSTADSGPGSLRDAIDAANLNAAPSTILFLIPDIDPGYDALSGAWTIAPASALPDIVAPLAIDGVAQPGAACNGSWPPSVKIVLSGAAAGPGAMGLSLAAGATGSLVRGLSVVNWSQIGIDINGASMTTVQGCMVGVDHLGLTAAPNVVAGIACRGGATDVLIGTDGDGVDDECERNVISGNLGFGVALNNAAAVISGNFIGVDATGLSAVGNLASGVRAQNSNVTIGRAGLLQAVPADSPPNIISGNGARGVLAEDCEVFIFGNLIGVDASGNVAMGNTLSGIRLDRCTQSTIGWSDQFSPFAAQERNVIADNRARGVRLIDCEDVEVFGNFVGLGADGDTALGNRLEGVLLEQSRAIALLHNVSSANVRDGLRVEGAAPVGEDILVWFNVFGADSTGDFNRGNGMDGLMTALGGEGVFALQNLIAFNSGNGVNIAPGSGRRNIIMRQLDPLQRPAGHQPEAPGVTPNDALDATAAPTTRSTSL